MYTNPSLCLSGNIGCHVGLDICEACKTYSDMLLKKQSKRRRYIFVTVNVKPGTTLEDLQSKMVKFISKKWVTDLVYTFEQRSEDINNVDGLHTHMLVYIPKKRPSEVNREIYSTFKHIVGTKKSINVNYIPLEWVMDKLNYIAGNKEEAKMAKVCVDRLWRAQNNLSDIYTHGEHFKKMDPLNC